VGRLQRRPALRRSLIVTVAFQCACEDGRSARAERQELAALTMAIAAVRDADNAHKSAPLQALRQFPCDRACGLQRVCVHAYELHLAVLKQFGPVLRDRERQAASQAHLAHLRTQLQEARLAISNCTDAEFEQRARLNLR